MTDLTERLRRQCEENEPVFWVLDVQEAADEIDRLRGVLEDISNGMGETSLSKIGRYAPIIARKALSR